MAPRELVELWASAFNRADADGLAAFYAEDAVNHQVAEAPVRGRAANPRHVRGRLCLSQDGMHRPGPPR
ncbi:nuclear transport factor 2 family protein [Uliginosibacterium sp. sgz301328]|uniref:YybH family protein n=1 Tax=Uliginosibacterium sp. sgz301328 TaxID=3243764 RepID=UPI00359D3CAE